MLRGLLALGPRAAVLTGIQPDAAQTGAACMVRGGDIETALAPRVPGGYHGTGDASAAALLGALFERKGPARGLWVRGALYLGMLPQNAGGGRLRQAMGH